MPHVTFKAKVEPVYNADETLAYHLVKVPEIKRGHCDMRAFRTSAKFSSYANSDLFLNMLKRALKAQGIQSHLRLDALPPNVTVSTNAFLATVTIDVT